MAWKKCSPLYAGKQGKGMSTCRQFENPSSEALHLELNIDKVASPAGTKSRTNDGVAREKVVVLTN